MDWFLPYVWVILAVIFAVIEISTTQLVSVWFVVASVVTAICASTFLYGYIIWQLVTFVLMSALCLIVTKPFVRRINRTNNTKTNSDRHIGKKCKVIADIDSAANKGQVEVEGVRWSAKSSDSTIIKAGTIVKIVAIEGVKFVVTPAEI